MSESEDQARPEKRLIVASQAPSELLLEPSLPQRAGYVTIRGINPFTREEWDIRISHARMDSVAKRSLGQLKELAHTLPEVLRYPTAVFQGVREDGERDWLCYCGQPSHAYDGATGSKKRAYLGEVYLVYVNADRVAYNSRWDKCDPDDIRLPCNYEDRPGTKGRFLKRLI
jgi:hypothetical protein